MRNRVVVMPVQRFSVVVPKRGMQRLIQKKPAAKKYANYKKVPYTRTGTDVGPRGVRKEQSKSKRSLPEILRASNEGIVRMLLADGRLPNWAGMQCPRCEKGTLSKLVSAPNGGGLKYRCNKKKCQVYLSPTHLHPWFTDGRGTSSTPLQTQAAVLLMKVHNVSLPSTCQLLNVNHKFVEDMGNRLTYARQDYVKEHQPKIKLGSTNGNFQYVKNWVDVEGDEASFTKSNMKGIDSNVDAKKPMLWEQWLGLVQRGRPDTLVLERLSPPTTEVRAPGPGAVQKVEWRPIASKHLKGRHIILHTDAARSYTVKVDQVLHDNVVHAKKRKIINGKPTWVRPTYVKVVSHRLPGTSKMVKVKAGTQIIDRAWRFLKQRLTLNQNTRAGSKLLRAQIQSAQYQYWFKNKDPWTMACDLSKFKMAKMMKSI